jgi:hypothetical protein
MIKYEPGKGKKAKLSLGTLIKHYAMKIHGGVEVSLHQSGPRL